MSLLLVALLVIITVLLIIGLFTTETYLIEREIDINKPGQEVFNYISHLKNQDYYNKMGDDRSHYAKTIHRS